MRRIRRFFQKITLIELIAICAVGGITGKMYLLVRERQDLRMQIGVVLLEHKLVYRYEERGFGTLARLCKSTPRKWREFYFTCKATKRPSAPASLVTTIYRNRFAANHKYAAFKRRWQSSEWIPIRRSPGLVSRQVRFFIYPEILFKIVLSIKK